MKTRFYLKPTQSSFFLILLLGINGFLLTPGYSQCPDGAIAVTAFGPFVRDLKDLNTMTANAKTVNDAINAVGLAGGGTICLPAGTYYLGADPTPTAVGSDVTILINHDNITLCG
jgi:hypothetical protein